MARARNGAEFDAEIWALIAQIDVDIRASLDASRARRAGPTPVKRRDWGALNATRGQNHGRDAAGPFSARKRVTARL